jgi:6-pyruvoyltetrahydropterin/6-carboxytetrahydropterin synthase
MDDFRITVGKENLLFAAGHFITYGTGACETLHGHNYRVGVTIVGELDGHSLVYDFVSLKRLMLELLNRLDHRMLIPTGNPYLEVVLGDGEIEVRHADRRFVFPETDVVVLPVPNTTAERLAEYLCDRLADHLERRGVDNLRRIEVEVEESIGQSGHCARDLVHRPR